MMITVKKLFLCGGVFLIVVIILMMIMTKGQPSGWLRLNEVEAYENILDSKISEITLRKTVDSANWVVFSDDDLIKIWIGCLKDMEVRRAKNFAPYRYEENGGGGSVVEIETETEKYSLVFRNMSGTTQLEIGGILYDIREPENIPFEETYDMAVERHGGRTPWD